MDPALFIHKTGSQQMCDAGMAVHVDDALNAGKKSVLDAAQENMEKKLTYGNMENLPFRFLGGNYKRGKHGEIVMDLQHYVDALELPNLRDLAGTAKQDLLSDQYQS